MSFDEQRARRWHKGILTYRGGLAGCFVGDPRHELWEELLDSANYIDEWQRQGLGTIRAMALRALIRLAAWLCR